MSETSESGCPSDSLGEGVLPGTLTAKLKPGGKQRRKKLEKGCLTHSQCGCYGSGRAERSRGGWIGFVKASNTPGIRGESCNFDMHPTRETPTVNEDRARWVRGAVRLVTIGRGRIGCRLQCDLDQFALAFSVAAICGKESAHAHSGTVSPGLFELDLFPRPDAGGADAIERSG